MYTKRARQVHPVLLLKGVWLYSSGFTASGYTLNISGGWGVHVSHWYYISEVTILRTMNSKLPAINSHQALWRKQQCFSKPVTSPQYWMVLWMNGCKLACFAWEYPLQIAHCFSTQLLIHIISFSPSIFIILLMKQWCVSHCRLFWHSRHHISHINFSDLVYFYFTNLVLSVL